jgi:hypothetical protein
VIDECDFIEGERYYYKPPVGSQAVYIDSRTGLIEVEWRRGKTTDNLGFYSPSSGSYLSIDRSRILCHVNDLAAAREREALGVDDVIRQAESFLRQGARDTFEQRCAEASVKALEAGTEYLIGAMVFGPGLRRMAWTGEGSLFEHRGGGEREGEVIDLDAYTLGSWHVLCRMEDAQQLGMIEVPVLNRDRSLAWTRWDEPWRYSA